MTDKELMQQAFDAMSYGNAAEREAARLALRDRLAQPAQQRHISYVCPQCYWSLDEQPEQEPVTLRIDRLNQWLDASLKDRKPAQREPLTDDEINNLELPASGTATVRDLVRIIEAAHGIKENK